MPKVLYKTRNYGCTGGGGVCVKMLINQFGAKIYTEDNI